MATFAKTSFNASVYSSFRPNYPQSLFADILKYHAKSPRARWDLAVDVGCGTGQATSQLPRFRRVLGVDPSRPMIEIAQQQTPSSNISFVQGKAEDLRGIVDDGSVDLLISAQASHWFDWHKMWPETQRVLRPGGSAAFWIYSEFRLSGYPSVTPRITAYAQGTDPTTSLGPHFQRPGRTILENLLRDVPSPDQVLGSSGELCEFQRVFYSGPHHPNPEPNPSLTTTSFVHPVQMQTTMRWRDLLGYFRTWSSLQTYHELFPGDRDVVDSRFPEDLQATPTALGGVDAANTNTNTDTDTDIDVRGGDIAVRFWKDLREGVRAAGGACGVDDPVSVEWPIALLLVKRA